MLQTIDSNLHNPFQWDLIQIGESAERTKKLIDSTNFMSAWTDQINAEAEARNYARWSSPPLTSYPERYQKPIDFACKEFFEKTVIWVRKLIHVSTKSISLERRLDIAKQLSCRQVYIRLVLLQNNLPSPVINELFQFIGNELDDFIKLDLRKYETANFTPFDTRETRLVLEYIKPVTLASELQLESHFSNLSAGRDALPEDAIPDAAPVRDLGPSDADEIAATLC